jgi:hypothetical protein
MHLLGICHEHHTAHTTQTNCHAHERTGAHTQHKKPPRKPAKTSQTTAHTVPNTHVHKIHSLKSTADLTCLHSPPHRPAHAHTSLATPTQIGKHTRANRKSWP